MAIHVPGKRDRRNRLKAGGRSAVAVLQLTAMVDMFTVLAVFLLQNYASTGDVLYIPEGVKLPNASAVKELKPANVVVVGGDDIMLNTEPVIRYRDVKEQGDILIPALKLKIEEMIRLGEQEKRNLGNQLQKAVQKSKPGEKAAAEDAIDEFRRITIQADKSVDFSTLKKVMFTVTESGIYEINFAVLKKEPSGT